MVTLPEVCCISFLPAVGPVFNIVPSNSECVALNPTAYVCEVEKGTTVRLDCQFTSVPAGSLDQVVIPSASNVRIEGESVIVIEEVNEGNYDDVYQCTASNVVAGRNESVTITIGMFVCNKELALH